jgi:RHS repeat-associated protein
LDRRIAKAADTTPQDAADAAITHFVYDREDVLLEFLDADGAGPNDPVLSLRYLHGPRVDQVLAQENFLEQDAELRVLWLLPDHLGTTRDLVDNAGTVRNHIIYDAFGQIVLQTNSAVSSRYLFTGREFDPETEFYYYRARYYDPASGRFLSEDPLRFAAGDENLYRYVRNHPIGATDPTGTQDEEFNPLLYLILILLDSSLREDACEYEYNVQIAAANARGDSVRAATLDLEKLSECDEVAGAEWLVLAGLSFLVGGRAIQSRRQKRRRMQKTVPRANPDSSCPPPERIDRAFAELAEE